MKKNMIRNLLTALFLAVSIVYAMPFAAFAANAEKWSRRDAAPSVLSAKSRVTSRG